MRLLARRPEIVLVGVTVVWSSTFIITKSLLREVPPLAYLAIRFSLAAGLLFLIAPRAARPSRRALVAGAILGLSQVLGLSLQVIGQIYTTASKSAFLTSLSTALTPFVAYALYRERPRRQQLGGVALCSIGLAALTWPQGAARWNTGDVLSLLSAAVYAWVIVETAFRTRGEDVAVVVTLQTSVAALLLLLALGGAHLGLKVLPHPPAFLAIEDVDFSPTLSVGARLLYMAVVCTVVTFLAQTWAMSRMPATQAAVVFALEPLFATALAVAVDGASEWPGARGAAGAALILTGLLVSELRPGEPSEPAAATSPAPELRADG